MEYDRPFDLAHFIRAILIIYYSRIQALRLSSVSCIFLESIDLATINYQSKSVHITESISYVLFIALW